MKKIFLISTMLLYVLVNAISQENILLKYYNLFSLSNLLGTALPKIFKNDSGKWKCSDTPSEESPYGWNLPVFDEKNYYLELEQEGDTESSKYTMAVYLSQDGNNVFAVSGTKFRESGGKVSRFAFYRVNKNPNGKSMENVTALILPAINKKVFFKKNFDFSALEKAGDYAEKSFNEKIINLSCIIPREGTVTKFSFEILLLPFFNDEIKTTIEEGKKAIQKNEVSFVWNFKKGLFEEK